jgi:hypothetical protein
MRTAGLSLLAVLAALHAITVNGDVTCNTRAPLNEISVISLSELQNRLSSTASSLCQTRSGSVGTISEQLDGLVLQLRRGEAVQDVKECQAAFAAIFSQCIETEKVSGGESRAAKGITYAVLPGSSDDYLSFPKYARAPAGSLKGGSSKPKPVTGNLGTGKPADGRPAAAKPVGGKPVANPSPKKSPTPAKSTETATKTKIKIGPTKDCKQIAIVMQTPSRGGRIVHNIKEAHGGFVGSRVDVNRRGELLRRVDDDDDWYNPTDTDINKNHEGTPKKGSACGITFDALFYPKAASMVLTNFRIMATATRSYYLVS